MDKMTAYLENWWLVALQVTKRVQKNSVINDELLDQVWWYNIKRFFYVIPKLSSANLCKPVHDIINYSTFICQFESGKCGKEGKQLQKLEYIENEKTFSDEIKSIFHSFWRAIICWKNTLQFANYWHWRLLLRKSPCSVSNYKVCPLIPCQNPSENSLLKQKNNHGAKHSWQIQ